MWLSQMHVAQPNTYFQMNLTIVNGGRVSSIAVYGRREAPPTVTNYDWVHIVAKDGRVIEKRSLSSSTGKELLLSHYCKPIGLTYLFGILCGIYASSVIYIRHTVILPDRIFKKWGLSNFAF